MKNQKEMFEALLAGKQLSLCSGKAIVFLTKEGNLSNTLYYFDTPANWTVVPDKMEFTCRWDTTKEQYSQIDWVYPLNKGSNCSLGTNEELKKFVGKKTKVTIEAIEE